MTEEELLAVYNRQEQIKGGSSMYLIMHKMSEEVRKYLCELNNSYHTDEENRLIMEKITGKKLDDDFRIFPPFYSDCGKNIHIGKKVFINACCTFQDQGGVYIGDNSLIGHGVMLLTLNHGQKKEERHDLLPKPIHIGENVWIGSGSIILPGVSIGDNTIIGAGSLVTKSIPANVIAFGSPCKVYKEL